MITYDAFELEYCAGCSCDSLDIYDGPDANSPLIDYVCNDDPNNLPNALITTQQVVFIRFISDELVNKTGFLFRVSGPEGE